MRLVNLARGRALRGRPRTRDALLGLAEAQNGPVARRQAIAEIEIDPTAFDALVTCGRLERAAPSYGTDSA
jgi:hypothetical protein